MKNAPIFFLAVLTFSLVNCTSRNIKSEATRNQVGTDSIANKETEFNTQNYDHAVELSRKESNNLNFELAIIYLKEAIRMNPKEKMLQNDLDYLKRSLAKLLKRSWNEAAIEEQYGKVYGNFKGDSCAIEKWRLIVSSNLEANEYYKKALAKLIQYELLD
jgi:hypothetical protein